MKARLILVLMAVIRLIERLIQWIDPPEEPPIELPDLDPLDRMAGELVAEAMTRDGSGEAKRHWVYARLLKAFPHRPKRDAGLAIELALQARGDR